MNFTVSHRFPIDVDGFWKNIFFDDAFNQRLYVEGLNFRACEVIEKTEDADGRIIRKMRYEPRAEMPAAAKKIFGDAVAYTEEGEFDPKMKRWRFRVIPGVSTDKVSISGELWVEPAGENQVDRVCRNDIQVNIFGVGSMLEKMLEKQSREGLEKAALFTQQFLKQAHS
ncbi:MAG: DUF2505 domain-containing protein [Myxococcales bacterium]|nr:MAG: DUF2505 domain-containing protein [Myxococcales bacterium]